MRTPRSRTRAAATAACLAVLSGIVGCARTPDPDTLVLMNSSTDEPQHTWNQELLDACGRRLGVRVEQVSVPAPQVVSKALRMASSRSLPDVLMLDGSKLPQFADTGGLVPLDELGITTDGLGDGAVSLGSYQGEFYGIARTVNSLALFYNADLLAQHGLEPPTTWDELRSAAAELTGDGTYGMSFSASASDDGTFQFLPFLWSNGADETRLDSPEAAEALTFWKDLLDDGSVSSAVVNWTQQDANDQFVAGNAAMMVNGPWQVPVLSEHPELDWRVAPMPVPEAGDAPVVPLGGEVMTVPRTGDPERQRRAAELVRCLNTEDNQLAWAERVNNVPTLRSASEAYQREHPDLAAFAAQVETARSRTARAGTGWPQISTAIHGAVQSALTGGATPEQALEHAQSQVPAATPGS
ncbi:ABC transporter substrate-binding protein [Allostreptomyces psammosilenae]|uniref:Multiple sugar transport system substrate-binding protein n=1 Tax=Allostreptomyces psammosilenae TaxID=1892865 RepID=A0A852ZML3_9ACTN|nr:ABC transporter substrate-binding protein [Allostreptomyces psammosilenae]NYI03639.1 multiple sugar transport system substrate-binding protein [Allostreptomyces psammosilenae]